MTPDAVLHRYVTLVSERHVDTEAIYRLVAADADLLSRWLTSLDCAADPKRIRQALGELDDATLIGISRAQIGWAWTSGARCCAPPAWPCPSPMP